MNKPSAPLSATVVYRPWYADEAARFPEQSPDASTQ